MEFGNLVKQQLIVDPGHVNYPFVQPIGLHPNSNLDSSVPQVMGFRRNLDVILRTEMERSMSLFQQMMGDEDLVPSPEEEIKRRNAIHKLKQIVKEWVKTVAYHRGLPKRYLRFASGTILTYGSYGLGVHNSESDIDALCVGPGFATIAEDFFIVLHNMLVSRPEVSDIHCVKGAKVPLMRFKFDGISIDLPYARLKVISIPEDVDVFNPFFLKNIDDTSWKSLSGVRANRRILQLVPNVEIFQAVLRCVKLWAKKRGVYGNLLGFFGGVHLAVLSAFICQRHPTASLSALIFVFFKTFAFWHWPTPVVLQDGVAWPVIPTDKVLWMPIQLPCSPYEFCHSNVVRSTFLKIKNEFIRGHLLTKDMLRPDFDWNILFEPFPYPRKYVKFVKIFLSTSDKDELGDWVGCVKSRFRCLIIKLEELLGFCDPNPTEYVDVDASEPNAVFYWGLPPARIDMTDIGHVQEEFLKSTNNVYQGPSGKMKLSIVQADQLPQKAHFASERRSTKPCWRTVKSNQCIFPACYKYQPIFVDRYLTTNARPVYPSAGG
ncbi:nuclear poly(A) polymerase 3-like isoform X1 [Lycium ferocissimum]|uniref:nuclear poly(A) polymerase 3-like isoform X1 n=1 Tax=Lycium ferocissimum TaxID=112874 RepID=UPI00281521DF|nr:nuclear poly(A) polymerase 3-like isoform X1 [Lycium ferocissimum]